MNRAELEASLRLWEGRRRFRRTRWKHWINRERRARTPDAKRRAHRYRARWSRLYDQASRMVQRRRDQLRERSDRLWGGSRYYTNRVHDIVSGRHRRTSRKRWELFGNRNSDHYRGNRTADASDYATADNHALKNEISRRLGGPRELPDYGSFNVTHDDRTYRVQIIAGTHGTGPHLHVGVRRV